MALINPEEASKFLTERLSLEWIEGSQVPAILLHNLSFSVVLTKDFRLANKLGEFLEAVTIEEGREDILCVLSIFRSKHTIKKIWRFLSEFAPRETDLSVDTALFILKSSVEKEKFLDGYERLLKKAEGSVGHARLVEIKKEKFDSLGNFSADSAWVKMWDEFDVYIFDDGMQFSPKLLKIWKIEKQR